MSALRPGGSTRAWRRLRHLVLERDGWVCQRPIDGHPCQPVPGVDCHQAGRHCHAPANTVGHVVPRAEWPAGHPGVDSLANLRAECGRHNYAGGAALTNGTDPDTPAQATYVTTLW